MTAMVVKQRVVLHRLRLDARKVSMFEGLGLEIVHVKSVPALEALSLRAGDIAVVDLALGSNAPERIVRYARANGVDVVLTTTNPSGAWHGRALRLQIEKLFAWPEGVSGELLRRAPSVSDVRVRRVSERAEIHLPFDWDAAGGGGEVVNISASGAMLEVKEDATDIAALALNLTLGEIDIVIEARTAWTERLQSGGTRLGVHFVNVDGSATRAIDNYVRMSNELRLTRKSKVGSEAEETAAVEGKVRVQKQGASRVDYFMWAPDEAGDATLVPQASFFAPYAIGDVLLVRPHGRAGLAEKRYRVRDRILVEPDRVDSPIHWRVTPIVGE
jgi:hypothetical protein